MPQGKHPLCYCSTLPGTPCDWCSGLRVADISDYRSYLEHVRLKVSEHLDACEEAQYTDLQDETDLLNWIAQRS